MERKIGEIFEYNGEWYQCLESNSCRCDYCEFGELAHCHEIACASGERSDNEEVYFKKLEKVGEPYVVHDHSRNEDVTVQDYKLYEIMGARYNGPDTLDFCPHGKIEEIVGIEIKQNKEEMEEKKLNLKPFDIQKAREGKPVCTRDGRKVRIICFDRKGNTPIVALIERVDGIENLHCFYNDGKCFNDSTSDIDLMMLSEKKEMWINIYKGDTNFIPGGYLYSTEKAARDIESGEDYFTTAKVSWEE